MKKTLKEFIPKKPKPLMWDAEECSVKGTSLKNEKRLSKRLGFDLTPGSGNTQWVTGKGDGGTDRYMVECKETNGKRLVIDEKVIVKLCKEASLARKDPLLVLSVYGLPEHLPKDWVLMPASLFVAME